MTLAEYLSIPEVKTLLKRVTRGSYLFRQGELGRTMFIVMDGTVELVAERDDGEHVEAMLEAGQFLGEKAVAQQAPHQRVFSARAATDAMVLELSFGDLERVQETAPAVIIDILKRVLLISGERLSRANYLIRMLRSTNNRERLGQCIRYFCRTSGRRTPGGIEVVLSAQSIHYYIDMEREEIEAALDFLVRKSLLEKRGSDIYLIPNENAIFDYFSRPELAAA